MHMNAIQRASAIEGARNYASFDKSDPFAFDRAMAHINSGAAHVIIERGKTVDVSGGYEAESYQEERRLPNGEKYNVTSYKNSKRP